jgi:hypothetical protein
MRRERWESSAKGRVLNAATFCSQLFLPSEVFTQFCEKQPVQSLTPGHFKVYQLLGLAFLTFNFLQSDLHL